MPRRAVLLHRGFQLKYAGLLVLAGALIMAALSVVLDRTAESALESARIATAQATTALEESQANSALVRQNIMLAAQDNPDLAKTLGASLGEDEQKARKNAEALKADAEELGRKVESTRRILVASFAIVLVLLFAAGIYVTKRVVEPVDQMKKLLRRVSTGRLMVGERLRKGDELEDLFETFVQMTNSLRAMERARLATLDATIKDAQSVNTDALVMEGLRGLRAELEPGLGMEGLMRRSQTSIKPPTIP
jgi:nitrogen fixation/metabolism regulation signal transduction histidine kinase